MAGEVTLELRAEIKDLKKKLKQSEDKLKKLAGEAKKTSNAMGSSFGDIGKSAKKLGGVITGSLGFGLAIEGVRLFGATVDKVMEDARRQAALTKSAFASAFGQSTAFNIGGETFTFETREQIVGAGRIAQRELSRVNTELENNFTRLVRSGVFEGTLEKFLAAGSLFGVGEDENRIFKTLTTRRDLLQQQVDTFTAAAESQVFLNQLGQQYNKELGLTSNKQKEINAEVVKTRKEAELLANIRPNFSGPLSVSGFQTFSNFGPLPPGPAGKKDLVDPSITLEILSLQRAVQAGVLPAFEGLRGESALLQENLLQMLDNGVKPSNVEFQEMFARMKEVQAQAGAVSAEVRNNAVAFNILEGIGTDVLSGIAFKFEEADSKAAQFRNTLRGIGNRFLNVALNAGINVGIGALTGNPIGIGAAIGSVVGLPTAANTSRDNLNLSSIGTSQLSRSPRQAGSELVATVRGDELLIMLREAQNTRGGGSGIYLKSER